MPDDPDSGLPTGGTNCHVLPRRTCHISIGLEMLVCPIFVLNAQRNSRLPNLGPTHELDFLGPTEKVSAFSFSSLVRLCHWFSVYCQGDLSIPWCSTDAIACDISQESRHVGDII